MDILYHTNYKYAPATIEAVSYQWVESHPIIRHSGFPHLLYLQTHSGSGKVNVAGNEFLLPEGYSVIISPHVPYTYESISSAPWATDFFAISGELVPIIPSILEYTDYLLITNDQDFDAQRMIKHWYETLRNYDELVNYLQISVDVLAFFVNLKTTLNRSKDTNLFIYRKYVKPTLDYIRKHYQSTITVSELANLVNVSPQYLSKLYNNYFEISCQSYLINYRITVAKTILIQYPDLPITEVAFESGFKTSSHFIEKFRSLTGYTPKKYRDAHYSDHHLSSQKSAK